MRLRVVPAALALALLTACGSTSTPSDFDIDSGADPVAEEEAGSTAPVEQAPVEQAPAPAAPAAPDSPSYDIGDRFEENCSVAWPSAPTITATDIQIASYCPRVPSTYPLVLVVYGDPSLPITPSTSSFRVVGEVYGTGQSTAGMPYLIVIASEVRL